MHPSMFLCMQRADLHGRAQDVLKRKLNVTLPDLEMPEVRLGSKMQHRSQDSGSRCFPVTACYGAGMHCLAQLLH